MLYIFLLCASLYPTVLAKKADTGWGADTSWDADSSWISPQYNHFFQFPLPIPENIKPLSSYTNSTSNTTVDFYQLNITAFGSQIYPDLGKADLVGYNGMSPGPTFRVQRGRQSVVRVVNENFRSTVLHLHGSYSRPVWDGWADDLIEQGQYKDYYFPNSNTPRTLWYHDHAVMITSVNIYSGLAGFFIIEDPELEARLGVPRGKYDVPLAISSKQYTRTGNLSWVGDETENVYGDVIEVNGQPWPYFSVEPRKYRFRILNTALSRSFILSIVNSAKSASIPFHIIASDSGFMSSSIATTNLTVAMAERWEIVVDFSDYPNQNLTLTNQRQVFDAEDFAGTDRVMQFQVGTTVASSANNGPVPMSLVALNAPSTNSPIHRTFKFDKHHDTWLINGVPFSDVKNRVLAAPQKGSTELWVLENQTGYWSHPIHIHMVDFTIVSRSKGRNVVEPYEKVALKDVALLGPEETVTIAVTFAPFAGLYMFHCHNTIHEDHAMMAAFNVTDGERLGYDAADLSFADPLEPKWRAKTYSAVNAQPVTEDTLAQFIATGAYANLSSQTIQISDEQSRSSMMLCCWPTFILNVFCVLALMWY